MPITNYNNYNNKKCIDRVFRIHPDQSRQYADLIYSGYYDTWKQYALKSPLSGFSGLIDTLIMDNVIAQGHYIILRQDNTTDPNNLFEPIWLGTVEDDMSISPGVIHDASQPPYSVVTWPSK